MDVRQPLKAEYKRLKNLVKKSPRLYPRVAALEIELGKVKSARKRLKRGLKLNPESTVAKSLLAEALSRLGQHEASLKEWEDVIDAEPFNQQARNGYVRELAHLEHFRAMSESLSELFYIDPFNTETADRQKEIILRSIKRKHAKVRVWDSDWNIGDFTGLGALAKKVTDELNLSYKRHNVPKKFIPEIDQTIYAELIRKLPKQDQAPVDSERIDRGDDYYASLEEAINSGVGIKDDVSSDIQFEETSSDISENDSKTILDSIVEEELETASDENIEILEEVPNENWVDLEDLEEEVVEENKLQTALDLAGVDIDEVVNLEPLMNKLIDDDISLVEKPVIVRKEDRKKKVEPATKTTESIPKADEVVEIKNDLEKSEAIKVTQNQLDKLESNVAPDATAVKQADIDSAIGQSLQETPIEPTTPESSGIPSQDALDQLVETQKSKAPPKESSGPMSQNDLDALVAATKAEKLAAPIAKPEPVKEDSGPMSQNDLDALIAATKAEKSATPKAKPEPEPEKEDSGPMSQNDLDALIAATKGVKAPEPTPEPEPEKEDSGPMSQNDLDALIAATKGVKAPEPTPEPEPEKEDSGPMSQNDLDALIAATKGVKASEPTPEPEPEKEDSGPMSQNDLDALIAATKGVKAPEPEPEKEEEASGPMSQNDLDALIAAKKGVKAPEPTPEPEPEKVEDELSGPLSQDFLDSLTVEQPAIVDFNDEISDIEEKPLSISPEDVENIISAKKTGDLDEIEVDNSEVRSTPSSQDKLEDLIEEKKEELEQSDQVDQSEMPAFANFEDLEFYDLEKPLSQSDLDTITTGAKGDIEFEDKSEKKRKYRKPPTQRDLDILIASGAIKRVDQSDSDETSAPEKAVGTLSFSELQNSLASDSDKENELPSIVESADSTDDLQETKVIGEDKPFLKPSRPLRPVPPPPPPGEEETSPEEFKGPKTKTFAKLCLAQGKIDHAAVIVKHLIEKSPDDSEILDLQSKIESRL
jgi:hypothetical protein